MKSGALAEGVRISVRTSIVMNQHFFRQGDKSLVNRFVCRILIVPPTPANLVHIHALFLSVVGYKTCTVKKFQLTTSKFQMKKTEF